MRSPDDPTIYAVGECAQHRGQVYGLVAPLWEQGKVLADHITKRNHKAAYAGSKLATKLKVMGIQLASMGVTEPADDRRRGRAVPRAEEGHLQEAHHPRRPAARRHPARRRQQGRVPDAGVRQEHARSRKSGCRCCSTSGRPRRRSPSRRCRRTCRSATATASPRRAIGACVRAGKRTPGPSWTRRARAWAAAPCKQLVTEVVAWACGGAAEEDPAASYYVPGVPLNKPELVHAIRERGLRSVSAVFRELAGGNEDPGSKPGLASLLPYGMAPRIRRRARRPLHQRPRARQHPEGRHLQRDPADRRGASRRPRSCDGSPTSSTSTACRWSS